MSLGGKPKKWRGHFGFDYLLRCRKSIPPEGLQDASYDETADRVSGMCVLLV